SVCLDAGELDYLAPLLRLVGNEPSKVSGREREHIATEFSKSRLKLRISKACIDLRVELFDDLGRHGLRRAHAEPRARLVARNELTQGRDVRQYARAGRGRDSERAQPTSVDILDRSDSAGEHDLHLSNEQIVERRPATTIRHVDNIDAGHHLE